MECSSGGYSERLLQPVIGGAPTVGVISSPDRARPRRTGWVICHSFGMEEGFLQPLEVEIARRLAAAGAVVMRFHGQGYGDSHLPFDAISVRGHIRDALEAADVLREETACAAVGFLGIRFGGTVALAAAAQRGGPAAIAVDPIVRGQSYLEPLLRAAVTTELTQDGDADADEAAALARLESTGELDVQGFPLTTELAEEVRAFRLDFEMPHAPDHVSIIQAGRGPTLRPEIVELTARLQRDGSVADTSILGRPDAWMLGQPRYHSIVRGRKADRQTELSDAVAAEVVRVAASLDRTTRDPSGSLPPRRGREANRTDDEQRAAEGRSESAWRELARFIPFENDHLAAVLTTPTSRPRGLVLLLQGGGGAPRSHRRRLWTRTARALAGHGIATIRMDYRGVGDSTGVFAFELARPPLEEARTVLDEALRALGDLPVGIVGNCVGASTAFALAASYPPCTSVVSLLPAVGPVVIHRGRTPTAPVSPWLGAAWQRANRVVERLDRVHFAPELAHALCRVDVLLLEGGGRVNRSREKNALRRLLQAIPAAESEGRRAEVWSLPTRGRAGIRPIETQRAAIEATVRWFDETMPARPTVDISGRQAWVMLEDGHRGRRTRPRGWPERRPLRISIQDGQDRFKGATRTAGSNALD